MGGRVVKKLALRVESRLPGRIDLTVSLYRERWRYLTLYVALLPVIWSPRPVYGRRWLRAWMFGRRGGGAPHLGPVGAIWRTP
jgi:hypothetical protein